VVNLRRVVLLVPVALLCLTTACGSELGPTQKPAVKVGPELGDLQVKLRALQDDQCQTVAVDTVYRECDRFVTEVVNLSAGIKASTTRTPRAGDISAAVDKLAGAGADFQQNQCAAAGHAPSAAPCTRDLTTVRDSLIVLGGALDQLAGH
jgi:hypothetical protein